MTDGPSAERNQPAGNAPLSFLSSARRVVATLRLGATTDPVRWATLVLLTTSSLGFAIWLLTLARQQWFVTDEFGYFAPSSESIVEWLLRPHNEHTIAFTKLWFGTLLPAVGLRHYYLYMVPLVVGHLVAVSTIYRLVWISTASRTVALGIALTSLAMGAGVGTLTWAGQFQFVGSIAAGLVAILLTVERRTRSTRLILLATTAFGTLNGSAFVAFGLASAVLFASRRRWIEAIVVSAIPLAWQAIVRIIWAPTDQFAASGLPQILRDGPTFAFSVLDTAISQTLGETHLSAAVLIALAVGALAILSADKTSTRTAMSRSVTMGLALATVLSLMSLIAARLGRGAALSSEGGYSYLLLATLLPLGAILLGHLARSRTAIVGVASGLVTLSLIGLTTISHQASALSEWKINGERVMRTAASQLVNGAPTYPNQIPVPETAPTVTQQQLRSWATSGLLDAVATGPVESDQASLNMQWEIAPAEQVARTCNDLRPGGRFEIPAGAAVSVLALQPSSAASIQYPGSAANRRFDLPAAAAELHSLAQRTAVLTVPVGSVRVCD